MGISDGLVFGWTRSGQFRKLISSGEQEGKVNTMVNYGHLMAVTMEIIFASADDPMGVLVQSTIFCNEMIYVYFKPSS